MLRIRTLCYKLCRQLFADKFNTMHVSTSTACFPMFRRGEIKYIINKKHIGKNVLSLGNKSYTKSNSENVEDFSLDRDSKVLKLNVPSLRLDLVLKQALGTSRNKIEKTFYDGRIRINGKKIVKKSTQVHEGDEIDVIKSTSPKNPDHLVVSRVEILDIKSDDDCIILDIRRFKSLVIENYENEPFKGQVNDN